MNNDRKGMAACRELEDCIMRSIEDGAFLSKRFFPAWFRDKGKSYFFLFKKNLSVTNLQHCELISLIRQHVFDRTTKLPVGSISFHTAAAFTETIDEIVQPVIERNGWGVPDIRNVAELYWPVMEKAIVIDSFFTSCAVFLPPNLDIDLLRICAESGYVHSCGYSLYVRRISKATQTDFYESIRQHFNKYREYVGRKVGFVPYSSEDFKGDKEVDYVKDALKDGIEGVKVRVEKVYMSNITLVKVLNDMKEVFKNELQFFDAGPYMTQHPQSSDSTLWLIADHSVNRSNLMVRGRDSYYICYHQLYFNNCPFHLFDENKPAWVAHTTIPHTLLGAMLNVTKPWVGARVVIGDPFGGTGTTWFESKKSDRTSCVIGDLNPMLPLLIEDNAKFFSMDAQEIEKYIESINKLIVLVRSVGEIDTPVLELDNESVQESLIGLIDPDNRCLNSDYTPYRRAMEVVKKLKSDDSWAQQSFEFSIDVVNEVAKWSVFERLVLYIVLRAELRFCNAYNRNGKSKAAGFEESGKYIVQELESLAMWARGQVDEGERVGQFSIRNGHYSKACSISVECLKNAVNDGDFRKMVFVRDARKIEEKTCDVIVTDPPYGINTEEELSGLSRLYAEVVEKLVAAVRDEGHLVICLPQRSVSGKPIPVCTRSKIIISQVLQAAERQGREIYISANLDMPMDAPPYYWCSSALDRTILHFRIREKKKVTA